MNFVFKLVYTLWSQSFIENFFLFLLQHNRSSMLALKLSYGHLRVLSHRFEFIAVPSRASVVLPTFLWNISATCSFQNNSLFMLDFINRFWRIRWQIHNSVKSVGMDALIVNAASSDILWFLSSWPSLPQVSDWEALKLLYGVTCFPPSLSKQLQPLVWVCKP